MCQLRLLAMRPAGGQELFNLFVFFSVTSISLVGKLSGDFELCVIVNVHLAVAALIPNF